MCIKWVENSNKHTQPGTWRGDTIPKDKPKILTNMYRHGI